ncbi:MAG TPA: fibronectin type III domain-containing protein [Thermoanaerobaculia bacterium]
MSTVRRTRRSQSGFSLAEVFVATAIFAVIFIAALLVYDRSNKIFKSGVEAADMQQNTRVAFDKLVSDTRLAGFDFDRDGTPTAAGESQQPDEQIEYAGRSALTIRGNFNYNGPENGRIAALESPNSQFPIVTTGNDEIVTYALVPDNPSAVTESMTFYADVTDGTNAKRQSYPGGSAEDTITITGIDLCDDDKNGDGKAGCDQPPYTLYRFTVNATGGVDRTPLANNIRDLQFKYFNDITGSSALAITDPGGGKYNPATPATLNDAARTKRAEIKAVRISLVGLNQSGDPGWKQPNEPITTVQNRRQYTLESMVVPRNLGKRGMREQQTIPPGVPELKTVCFNYCGLVRVTWEAPPADTATGEVETYHVLWDTDTGKTMSSPPQETQSAGLATTTVISGLDPNTEYRFSVAATNSYGTTYATGQVLGKPLNATTPEAPTLDKVSDDGENSIQLTWTLPTANIGAAQMSSCKSPAGAVTTGIIPPETGEMQGIEVWRSTDINFNPLASPLPSSTVKVGTPSATAGGFADTTAANCIPYYYRIRLVEYCGTDSTKNVGSIVGVSDFYPKVGNKATPGSATSDETPSQPGPLIVNTTASTCTGSGATAVCNVSMSWPQVTTDLKGNTIAIDTYDVHYTYGGGKVVDLLDRSIANGDLTVASGVVTYIAKNLPKVDPSTLVDYVYEFSARATQCGIPGDYSKSDTYPKCIFAGGESLKIVMSGVNAGTGLAADPFEILGAETITYSVPTKKIVKAEATVYNVATGAAVTSLPTATGTTNTLSMGWPDSGDNTNFRIDYTVTDSGGCSQSGSFYVRETVITCPFETITSPTEHLADPASVSFPLKNLSDFDVTIDHIEITWDETGASSKDVTGGPVTLPSGSGSGTVTATLTGSTGTTGTFTATSASAAKLFANDKTGNYIVKVGFTIQGNKDLIKQPISNVIIFYKLPGDVAADGLRQCDVY